MATTEYLYYARKTGAEEWEEDLVLTLDNPISDAQKNQVFALMEQNGYELTSFRESIFTLDGSVPDFAATINR